MDTHTCLTCDNQTTSDQCIICNPEGYISPGYKAQDVKFNSEFIKDFGSVTMSNFKLRYDLLNTMSNHATDYGNAKIANLVIWFKERKRK